MISLRSGITQKLLNYFFINPQESLYVNELSRKLRLDKRNLVKKIKELEREGILKSEAKGNLKLYTINRKYPLYGEYRNILMKMSGFEAQLRKILKEVRGIKEAYIYGSYAKNAMDVYSDIDLLIVGEHNILLLQKRLNQIQRDCEREINAVNMDEKEFKKRVKNKDPFILEVLRNKHIRMSL